LFVDDLLKKLKFYKMKDQSLEIKTAIQILKPVNEVFEAIVDPNKMSNYFISRSSGRLELQANYVEIP